MLKYLFDMSVRKKQNIPQEHLLGLQTKHNPTKCTLKYNLISHVSQFLPTHHYMSQYLPTHHDVVQYLPTHNYH